MKRESRRDAFPTAPSPMSPSQLPRPRLGLGRRPVLPLEVREQYQKRPRALGHEHRPVPTQNYPCSDVLLPSRHEENERDVRDEHVHASLLEEVHPQHPPVLALVRPLHVVRDDECQTLSKLLEQAKRSTSTRGTVNVPTVRSRRIEELLAQVSVLDEEENRVSLLCGHCHLQNYCTREECLRKKTPSRRVAPTASSFLRRQLSRMGSADDLSLDEQSDLLHRDGLFHDNHPSRKIIAPSPGHEKKGDISSSELFRPQSKQVRTVLSRPTHLVVADDGVNPLDFSLEHPAGSLDSIGLKHAPVEENAEGILIEAEDHRKIIHDQHRDIAHEYLQRNSGMFSEKPQGLANKHGVTEGEKSIFPIDGFLIGGKNMLATGEGRNEHE